MLSCFQCGAFRSADRDDVFRVRTCEFVSAGETTASPNLRENSRNRFSASAIESSTMHLKRLMIDSPILKEAAKE